MAVLDGQRDQSTRPAGYMPGETAPQPAQADTPERIGRDLLVRQVLRDGLGVDPFDQLFNPSVQACAFKAPWCVRWDTTSWCVELNSSSSLGPFARGRGSLSRLG
ncbi:hypothetical protein ABIA39_008630 [Nocardia sp. GAS34]|uniref:hypothetical protein n=1 Tax=unclassified Nocardia TaxID=2637762 RepID=UPI003D23769E